MRSELLRDLQGRELIADVTTPDELDAHLTSGRRTAYVGFDPTADSLHVGSLLPLLTLRRVQLAGHRPIVLVGGGTGLIGDPSGKAGERALNPKEQVAEWAERLKRQVRPFLDFDRGPNAAILADNYAWLSELDVIGFLRDIGKHFPVGAMLARESVKARMGAGISFTEFSYQVLQAYDFMSLMLLHDCSIQLGGSDQWGNITAGVELIRRVQGRPAFGLTMPLVTKTDGSKFGKTESGTIWLDPARTSAYEMYQFWLNTPDADVVRFLRYFTFLPPERIAELAAVTRAVPEKREAHRARRDRARAWRAGDAKGRGGQRRPVRRGPGRRRGRARRARRRQAAAGRGGGVAAVEGDQGSGVGDLHVGGAPSHPGRRRRGRWGSRRLDRAVDLAGSAYRQARQAPD